MVSLSYFDRLPHDIVFIIIDKLDFDSAINLTTTTSYYTQTRLLKHLANKLSDQHLVLIAQQKDLNDLPSIKNFLLDFTTLQKHRNIISSHVNKLHLNLMNEKKAKDSNFCIVL